MKIIDKNGKLFGKVSILDIVILLCVVFLAAVFVMGRTGGLKLPISTKTSVNYTAKFKAFNIENSEKYPFEVGSSLYGMTGEYIGKVTEVEKKPYTTKERLASGKYFDYESQTANDYFITVEGSGTESEKGIFAEGTFALYPNNSVQVSSRYFSGNIIVLSVEKRD